MCAGPCRAEGPCRNHQHLAGPRLGSGDPHWPTAAPQQWDCDWESTGSSAGSYSCSKCWTHTGKQQLKVLMTKTPFSVCLKFLFFLAEHCACPWCGRFMRCSLLCSWSVDALLFFLHSKPAIQRIVKIVFSCRWWRACWTWKMNSWQCRWTRTTLSGEKRVHFFYQSDKFSFLTSFCPSLWFRSHAHGL